MKFHTNGLEGPIVDAIKWYVLCERRAQLLQSVIDTVEAAPDDFAQVAAVLLNDIKQHLKNTRHQ